MLPAYVAAAIAARRKAEESAEFARQLPLYAEEIAYPPHGEGEEMTEDHTPGWAKHF